MLRFRMWRIIRQLRKANFPKVRSWAKRDAYKAALLALYEAGCVDPVMRDGDLVDLKLKAHHVMYQLEREDLWINRIWGFISGVAVTLAAQYLLNSVGL